MNQVEVNTNRVNSFKAMKIEKVINPQEHEFVAFCNGKFEYGGIEDVKEFISNTCENEGLGIIRNVTLGIFKPLNKVSIESSYEYKVAIRDENDTEEDSEFQIWDNNVILKSGFTYRDDVEKALKALYVSGKYKEDDLVIVKKATFTSSYDLEKDINIEITIPPQEMDIVEKITSYPTKIEDIPLGHFTNKEIIDLLHKVQVELSTRHTLPAE